MLTAAAWPDADQSNSAVSMLCGKSYTPSENTLELNKK